MILQATPPYPSQRSYVLKLHRDADPGAGRLRGRLEHIASGDHVDFGSATELLDWLARHAAAATDLVQHVEGDREGEGPPDPATSAGTAPPARWRGTP